MPFVDDESNEDVSIPRNRVRAELLPLLEERFNPGIVDVLADQAEVCARGVGLDGRDRVATSTRGSVRRCREPDGAVVCEIDVDALARRPARAAARAALAR